MSFPSSIQLSSFYFTLFFVCELLLLLIFLLYVSIVVALLFRSFSQARTHKVHNSIRGEAQPIKCLVYVRERDGLWANEILSLIIYVVCAFFFLLLLFFTRYVHRNRASSISKLKTQNCRCHIVIVVSLLLSLSSSSTFSSLSLSLSSRNAFTWNWTKNVDRKGMATLQSAGMREKYAYKMDYTDVLCSHLKWKHFRFASIPSLAVIASLGFSFARALYLYVTLVSIWLSCIRLAGWLAVHCCCCCCCHCRCLFSAQPDVANVRFYFDEAKWSDGLSWI